MEELEFSNRIDLTELHEGINTIKKEIAKVIVGQKNMVNLLLTANLLLNNKPSFKVFFNK